MKIYYKDKSFTVVFDNREEMTKLAAALTTIAGQAIESDFEDGISMASWQGAAPWVCRPPRLAKGRRKAA